MTIPLFYDPIAQIEASSDQVPDRGPVAAQVAEGCQPKRKFEVREGERRRARSFVIQDLHRLAERTERPL